MTGCVIGLYTASRGQPPQYCQSVNVVAGQGIIGDRYYAGTGSFSRKYAGTRKSEITLIAAEAIDEFNAKHGQAFDYGCFRRNVITRGVDLNQLVGERFAIAEVGFEGLELCEPCQYLARMVHGDVLPDMVSRSGLRAAILNSGALSVGDPVA